MALLLQRVTPEPSLILPELIDAAADPKRRNPELIEYVGRLGPTASNALPALRDAWKDPDLKTRTAACKALMQVKPDPGFIPELIEIVADPKRCDRDFIRLLASFGPAASNAIPIMIRLCLNKANTSDAAHEALREHLKPAPTVMIPVLINIISNPSLRMGDEFAWLGSYGPEASNAVPVLLKIIEENDSLREPAIDTLKKIDPSALEQKLNK